MERVIWCRGRCARGGEWDPGGLSPSTPYEGFGNMTALEWLFLFLYRALSGDSRGIMMRDNAGLEDLYG